MSAAHNGHSNTAMELIKEGAKVNLKNSVRLHASYITIIIIKFYRNDKERSGGNSGILRPVHEKCTRVYVIT